MQGVISRLISPLFRMFGGGEPIPAPDASTAISVVVPKVPSKMIVASSSDENAAGAFTGVSALSDEIESDERVASQAAPASTNSLLSKFSPTSLLEYQPFQTFVNCFVSESNSPLFYRLTTQSEITELQNDYPDIASRKLGAKVLFTSNEGFADACNLNNPLPAVDMTGQFCPRGACYDGWETARHNIKGVEYVVIRLVVPVAIKGVDMDCSTFSCGNAFTYGSLQAGYDNGTNDVNWDTIIPKTALIPKSHNFIVRSNPTKYYYNVLRFLAYPDGGMSRLRVYGKFRKVGLSNLAHDPVDLAFIANGGKVIDCSNEYFGRPNGILYPGHGKHMGEGWETARVRRTPKMSKTAFAAHNEWVIIKLGAPGILTSIKIDTTHFVYNFPPKVQVFAVNSPFEKPHYHVTSKWTKIAAGHPKANRVNEFEVNASGCNQIYTHIMVKMFPDGGLQKVRVMGYFMDVGAPRTILIPKVYDTTNLGSQSNTRPVTATITQGSGSQSVAQPDTPYHMRKRSAPVEYFTARKRGSREASNATGSIPSKASTPRPKRAKKQATNSL